MAVVPVPDRGTPLDVTFLYSLANAINDISNVVNQTINKYTKIQVPGETSPRMVRTNETRIITGYVSLVTNDSVTANTVKDYTFNVDGYQYIPNVVITPVNNDSTSKAGNDVIITITSVTTSAVNFSVKFLTTGKVSVSANVIAIGIPS